MKSRAEEIAGSEVPVKNWKPSWRQGLAIVAAAIAVVLAATNLAAAVPAFEAAGIRIPVMNSNRTATIATLTAARANSDHQRFGAFSVKLLPRVVVEGVVLEITDPQAAGEAIGRLAPQLRVIGRGDSFEVHGFTLRFAGEAQPRFTADLLRAAAGTKSSLLSVKGGQCAAAGERLVVPARARLDCATGCVTWVDARQVIQCDLIGGSFSTNQLPPIDRKARP